MRGKKDTCTETLMYLSTNNRNRNQMNKLIDRNIYIDIYIYIYIYRYI